MTVLNILIISFLLSVFLAFFAGFLVNLGLSYSKATENKKKIKQLESISEKYLSQVNSLKKEIESLQSPSEQSENNNDTVDLAKEIEILNAEIDSKNKEISELKENSNRLGKRILEVETELRNTQSNLIEKPADIQEGMDTLLEALQKESDVLREDLENAYRNMEKQEEEIRKLKLMLDGKKLEEIQEFEDHQVLKQQIEELKEERDRYKSLLRQNDIPIV